MSGENHNPNSNNRHKLTTADGPASKRQKGNATFQIFVRGTFATGASPSTRAVSVDEEMTAGDVVAQLSKTLPHLSNTLPHLVYGGNRLDDGSTALLALP